MTTSNHQEAALLFLHAQTALHPGSGTALGAVDLPVQRERHTQWPTIPGSSLKGILRDACREKAKVNYQAEYERQETGGGNRRLKRTQRQVANEDDPMLVAAFGPGKIEPTSTYAGALSLTDARILAFPVRSLKGVFAWVTCSAVLERLRRDVILAGPSNGLAIPPSPGNWRALCSKGPLLVDGSKLVLEEFEFERTGDPGSIPAWIASRAISESDDLTRARVIDHLVILSDDEFTHFVRHATEVVARIALDYETKTVKGTALFYEEFLPAETLFYSVVLVSSSRRPDHEKSSAEILAYVRAGLGSGILQVGGDETIGKGLCAVRLSDAAAR